MRNLDVTELSVLILYVAVHVCVIVTVIVTPRLSAL